MKNYLFLLLFSVGVMVIGAEAKKPIWAGNKLGKEALSGDYIDPNHAPLKIYGNSVVSGFKKITFDKFGLPKTMSWKDYQILSYPTRLEFDDDRASQKLQLGTFTLKKNGKNSVVGEANFKSAGLKFQVKSQIDFDFTIRYTITVTPEKGAVTVKKLSLVFPINAPDEKLVMYYAEGPNRPEAGVDAQKRRVHLTIKPGDYRQIVPGFCSLFWVGTTNYGLSWNFESAKNWVPYPGNEMTFDPGTGNYSMNVIQKTTKINKATTFDFFLTPTPVRNMPKNWRSWNYHWRGTNVQKFDRKLFNQLIYWSSTFRALGAGGFNNLWLNDIEGLKKAVKEDKGMNKAVYYIPQLITSRIVYEDEDGGIYSLFDEYLDQLCKKYQRTPGMKPLKLDLPDDVENFATVAELEKEVGKDYFKKHKVTVKTSTYDVVFVPELADHMIWALNDMVNKYKAGGIYYDGINPQHNYSDWAAWTDSEGNKRPFCHIADQRALLKRARAVVKKADPNEMIIAHQSGTRPASTLSLCDAIIPGETFFYWYHEPEKRDASQNGDFFYAHIVGDIDNLKGEFFYRQWGIPHILLPEIRGKNGAVFPKAARGTRTMLAHTIHFDMLYFPTMSDVNEIFKFYKVRNQFGMKDTSEEVIEFTPYWENKMFTSRNKNCKISFYEKVKQQELYTSYDIRKKYMVMASNISFGDDEFTIKLPKGLKKAVVREMQTNKIIPVKNGQFTYPLIAYDFAIFEITGELNDNRGTW